MTQLLNARILVAIAMIIFVGAVTASATGAFFSDTETSTGNTFAAGDIDLQIDNTSYITSTSTGALIANPTNSWAMNNLTNQLFFSFTDLKPGDIGEDTISVHVGSNNAWACMALDLTAIPENTLVDPETDAGDVGPALGDNGELQNYVEFAFWKDDGDNVYEVGETQITQLTGLASTIFNGSWLPLADSQNGPALVGGATNYIGKAFCFGDLVAAAVVQDNATTSGPLARGTGFTCNGAGNQNDAQTDGMVVDVSFQAVQSRNNPNFLCSSLPPLGGGEVNRPLVGAANFVAPEVPACNVTVDDSIEGPLDTIQEGVDSATAGQVVCVAPGTYNEFSVNKALTVRGLSDPEGGTPAVVNPSSAAVTDLALVTASDVTITGLKFDGNNVVTTGQAAGIRVSDSGASLSNVNITYNVVTDIHAAVGFAAKGIQWFTDTNSGFSLSNSSFNNNTISDIAAVDKGGYGIQTVGAMSNVAINNNTISNTTGAWGAAVAVDSKNTTLTAVTGSSITRNQLMSLVSDGITRFSVQVENGINAAGIAVNQNNIETSLHGGGNTELGGQGILNAENNWYGTAAPVIGTDVFNTGTNTTDFSPSEAAVFALN